MDENFELMPAEGEIWPGTTVDVTVVFRPTEPKHYQQVRNAVPLTLDSCKVKLKVKVYLNSASSRNASDGLPLPVRRR